MELEYPPSSWRRLFAFGTSSAMPYVIRRQVWIASAASWSLVVIGGVYLAANIFQGYDHLVPHNIAAVGIGVVTLCLLGIRRPSIACAFISLSCCAVFTYSSLRFSNGSQDYLVLSVMVASFVMEHNWSRIIIASINGGAFVAIRILQFPHHSEAHVPFDRYLATSILIVITAAVISEYICRLDAAYRHKLEKNSAKLTEANDAKRRLFSIISHDLRGPVGNLKTTLEALQDGHIDAGTARELLPALKADVCATYDSLENLLYWSAQQEEGIRSRPEPVILLQAVEETQALLNSSALAKNISVERAITPGAVVLSDPEQLRTVLRNLLSNAVKFTPAGGHVKISSQPAGSQLQVVVSDTGIGLSPTEARTIFEGEAATNPGTAREKGFGLGLNICRAFVEQNKGRIWVEENPGGGSRFCFTVPTA